MKLLFIVPYIPDLVRVRSFNFIRHLKKRGHHITLLCISSEKSQSSLDAMRNYVDEARAFPLPIWKSILNCGFSLPSARPLQSVFAWHAEMGGEVQARLATKNYDLVHVEHLRGVRYALAARESDKTTPVIWDSVDSITHLFRQTQNKHPSRLARILIRLELSRTQQYEKWLSKKFHRVLVTSQIDQSAFLSMEPDARVNVVTNGVDISYFRPPEGAQRDENTILVSGKMSYHANVSMALYLIKEIMPLIWAQNRQVNLVIVGKDPPNSIREASLDPRIKITGTVPEILPWLQKATVSVAPLTYGAGVQNKVLEAMACATPVVASPLAVSALKITCGKDILVADSPQQFTDCILRLIQNKQLQQEIGDNGRKYVENEHSWEKITGNLEDIYLETIRELKE
ncbi:MAG: glycosyltransferase [Chloroflexota bacterium]